MGRKQRRASSILDESTRLGGWKMNQDFLIAAADG